MPTDEEEAVSEYFRMRRRVLLENCDDDVNEFVQLTAGEETQRLWGPSDTSLNPLASQTRQLVTPGLYGRTPTFTGDRELDDHLVECGFWSTAQVLQFLVVGLGAYWRKLGVRVRGSGEAARARIVDELISPSDVRVLVAEDDPRQIVAIWHLRIRRRRSDGKRRWVWDVWSLGDGEGSAPSYRVHEPAKAGAQGLGDDVSGEYLQAPDKTWGPLAGDAYLWRTPEGDAFLPWVLYSGEVGIEGVYPTHWRRSTYRGTFRACALWTFAMRCALHATGEHTLIGGVDVDALPGSSAHRGGTAESEGGSGNEPIFSMSVQPGTVTVLPLLDDKQLTAHTIGAAVNLPNQLLFAGAFTMMLAVADGLHPTDATQQSANPSSGTSLEIKARSRREFAAQVTPLFRAADMSAIRMIVWLLAMTGIEVSDEFSITYQEIPLTPQEQEDLREHLSWARERGQISSIDEHVRLFPGKTPEQARADIMRARVDEAVLEAEVQIEIDRQLAALGIARPKPPTSPDPDDEDEPADTDTATDPPDDQPPPPE